MNLKNGNITATFLSIDGVEYPLEGLAEVWAPPYGASMHWSFEWADGTRMYTSGNVVFTFRREEPKP